MWATNAVMSTRVYLNLVWLARRQPFSTIGTNDPRTGASIEMRPPTLTDSTLNTSSTTYTWRSSLPTRTQTTESAWICQRHILHTDSCVSSWRRSISLFKFSNAVWTRNILPVLMNRAPLIKPDKHINHIRNSPSVLPSPPTRSGDRHESSQLVNIHQPEMSIKRTGFRYTKPTNSSFHKGQLAFLTT